MNRSGHDQWKASEVARLLALVESERRYYQDLFSAVPVPLLLVDSSLAVVMANREFRRRFDLVSADLSQSRLEEILKSAELPDAATKLLGGSQVRTALDALAVTGQGEVPVRLSLQVHRGWEESTGDEILITVESPGGGQEPALAPALAEGPVPAWALDLNSGHYRGVNRAARALPVDGDSWGSLASRAGFVHAEFRERWVRFYREAREAGSFDQLEYAVGESAGLIGWRRDVVRFGAAGEVSGVTLDVTVERRSSAHQLESSKQQAVERLAGRVAHVANNLLMIISGYAEELMTSMPESDSRRADLQEIVKASDRMGRLTAHLNRLVRPPKWNREAVELRAWMNTLLPELSAVLPGVSIQAGAPAQSVVMETSPAVLGGLLLELAKVLRPGFGPGMSLVLNGAGSGEGQAVVWLQVVGGSVPDAIKQRALEPFAGPKEGADPPLGVAGWLQPWRELGGTLVLETEPADRFLLVLTCPARTTDEPAPQPGPRLLVVEDEESIRALVVRALGREGYQVESLASAQGALEAVREAAGELRLLITDFNMPGMSGMQLARQARDLQPDLKILLISGATEDEAVNAQLSAGLPEGYSFLQKPFGPGALAERVRQLLA